MIAISVDEKKIIREECPKVHIARTMKQRSKRHRYYMEEEQEAMRVLRRLRGEPEPEQPERPRRKGV